MSSRRTPAKAPAAKKAAAKRTAKPRTPRETPEARRLREFAEQHRLVIVAWEDERGRIEITLGIPEREWWEQAATGDEFTAAVLRVVQSEVSTR